MPSLNIFLIYTFLLNVHSPLLSLSFTNLRWSLQILHTLGKSGLYFEPYITNSFTDFSFPYLSQVWRLWSSTTSHGSVILLPSSLIRRCWYVDSKALLFSSNFFELQSLHDFASLTSLFLFIWLNSDSSLRTLHMVHTWGILFYAF